MPSAPTTQRQRRPASAPPWLFVGAWIAAGLAGCARFQDQPLSLANTASHFEQRSLDAPELRAFLAKAQGQEPSPWPRDRWDLDSLTLAALKFHPGMEVAASQAQLGDAMVRTAAGRPNPTLGLQGGYNFDVVRGLASGAATSAWIPGLSVDVPIETAGKRRLRQSRAALLAEAARLDVLSVAWTVRAQVHAAWIDAAAVVLRRTQLRSQVELQRSMTTLLEDRLAVGSVTTQEVGTARMALIRLESEAAAADRAETEARARLAEAIGLPAAAMAAVRLDVGAPTPTSPSPRDLPALRRRSLQERADVRAALASYEASQRALELEVARQYPDLHLGNGYQWDQGESKWTLGIGLELPVLNRNQGPISEAEAHRRQAAARVIAAQALAAAQVEHACTVLDRLEEARRQALRLQQESARQLALVEARREVGASDTLEVQQARLELALHDLALLDLSTQSDHARAQIEAAVQPPLPSLVTLSPTPPPR